MTQTEEKTEVLALGQLVRIKDCIGWFWITELPDTRHDNSYVLYGGLVGRGGVYAKTRYIERCNIEIITTPGKRRKAEQTRHAINEALAAAPRVSSTRKPGKK